MAEIAHASARFRLSEQEYPTVMLCNSGMSSKREERKEAVSSGSMEPALSVDDLILVRRADSYFVGDVVVYHGGRMPVVHRIVFADEKTVITQGDANNAPDEPISPSDIDGRVVGSLPKAGVVVAFMRTPTGALLIAGMALLLLWLSFQREQQQSDRQIAEIKAEIERLRGSQQNREPSNESSEDQDL